MRPAAAGFRLWLALPLGCVGCFGSHGPGGPGGPDESPGQAPAPDAAVDPPDVPTDPVDGDDGPRLQEVDCSPPAIVDDAGDDPSPVKCLEGPDGVVEGVVRGWTQADIDALEGVREVTGTLHIGDVAAVAPLNVVTLDALRCLRTVGGDLMIQRSLLSTLDGLVALESVGGYLNIAQNDRLHSLAGLQRLATVGNGMSITANHRLHDLGGLGALRVADPYVYISENDCLTTLDGLGTLASIHGLQVSDNPSLTGVDGLSALQRVVGDLHLFGNPMLSRCDAEALASRLGRACDETTVGGQAITCVGPCECSGNDNDVVCP